MNTVVPLNKKMTLLEGEGKLGIPAMVSLPTTD